MDGWMRTSVHGSDPSLDIIHWPHRIFSCGCQCPSPASISYPPASRPTTFTSFPFQVNDTTVLGAGGDYADFQFISDVSFIRTVFSQNETFISYVSDFKSVDCSVNFLTADKTVKFFTR